MKSLERAVRVYCALCESPIRVSSSGARDWATVQDAIQHVGGLLMEMRSLKPDVRDRVLAYVCELSPLNEHAGSPAYIFPDEKKAQFFVNEVTRAGGHTSYVGDGTIVSADMDGMDDVVEAAAASFGGTPFRGPNLQEEYERVDTTLPEALMTSALDPARVEEALIQAIYGSSDPNAPRTLNESLWLGMDSTEPMERFRGRLDQFCKPKKVLGVSAHIAEAVRIAGFAPAHLMDLLEVGGANPGVAGTGAANQGASDQARFDRGGVAKDQPDSRGQPAGPENGEQERIPAPTEHVPAQEQGGQGGITLSNGMVVPQEVIAQAMGKMLQNLATQVTQGVPQNGVPQKGPGTQPPAVQAVQQQGASQAAVGAQADPQQPAGQNSAQPQGSQPAQPQDAQGAPQDAPPAQGGEQPQQDPNAQQGAPEAPQPGQEQQAPANGEAPAQPGQEQAPQPNPEIDQLITQAEQGDQEAMKKVQGMQGEMSDEQKQKLQAILQQQNGGGEQPAQDPNAPQQESLEEGIYGSLSILAQDWDGERRGPGRGNYRFDSEPDAEGFMRDANMEYPRARMKMSKVRSRDRNKPREMDYVVRVQESKMTKKGQDYVSGKIKKHMKGGKPQRQAVAIAMSQAREGGYKGAKKNEGVHRAALGAAKTVGKATLKGAAAGAKAGAIKGAASVVAGAKKKKKNEGMDEAALSPALARWTLKKAYDTLSPMLGSSARAKLGSYRRDAGRERVEMFWHMIPEPVQRDIMRAYDSMEESTKGKPQHGMSDKASRKASGKTSSDRDRKGKGRFSRTQAGGGRKFRRGGSSSDYGHAKSQRKEPMSEQRIYGMVHQGRGTSVWEPLDAETSWPGAILPEGVDYGLGECEPGTPVMVLERGEETSLVFLPEGHQIRCPNEHMEDGGFYIMEGGKQIRAMNLSALLEHAGINDVVLVVGTPTSGKSHYLRSTLGPALREESVPDTMAGLVSEACVVEAAEIMRAWQQALNEDDSVTEGAANEAVQDAIGRAAHQLFFDRDTEALVQIGETLVIDCASHDPYVTDFQEILEACEGMDVLLADFRTPLTVAQQRNDMRMVEDTSSRSDLVRSHSATRRVVNELWADPRVTHRVSYEWIGEDALDGKYVTEGTMEKGVGPREKRQIGKRTTYDIDGDDPKDPKMRKQIVTMESLAEGYVPLDEAPSATSMKRMKDVADGTKKGARTIDKDVQMYNASVGGQIVAGALSMDALKSILKKGGLDISTFKKIGQFESINEQLDVGQAAEGASTAKAMQEAGMELKKAREAIFKLTTASMVQVSSMAKAAGMKRTASASEAAMTAASGLLDDLQKIGQLLDKTNETMKGENNGQGGDNVEQMDGDGAPVVNTGPGQDVVVQAGNGAPPPAPVPTPEAVEATAIATLLESEVIDMIRDGSHHEALNEALMALTPELDVRQRARAISRLEVMTRVPSGADISISMGPRDREALLEVVTHGSLSKGLLERLGTTGETLATQQELTETVQNLKKHGGSRQLLLAQALGTDTSRVSS